MRLNRKGVWSRLIRSARRHRTIELTVDRTGTIRVAAPIRAPLSAIEALLWPGGRGGCGADRGAGSPTGSSPPGLFGERIRYLGALPPLVVIEARGSTPGARMLVGAVGRRPPDRGRWTPWRRPYALEAWYRRQASAELESRTSRYAAILDVPPPRVLVRAQKHLWGSCSSSGVVRFNWRLIIAPPPLVDYVVVHELSHLRHPHHQRPFWEAVAAVLPDWRERRAELRRDGGLYDF